ncbi:MAG: zinc dependent phospholipase C family protein [Thermodesulfobacteriota bacterium]
MPFENTHLYLAEQVKQALNDEAWSVLLNENLDHYRLGSVFPDIMFYSKDESLKQRAYRLHGTHRSPTNELIFGVLDLLKGVEDSLNFAFIAGYLTHCAADITFHTMVYYISGHRANRSKQEAQRTSYLHWHYETLIDNYLNDRFNLHEVLYPSLFDDLVAPQVLAIDRGKMVSAFNRQRRYFSMIQSPFYYRVFCLLRLLRLTEPKIVAGFYENLKYERVSLPEVIPYRDVISGENREATIDQLAQTAVERGKTMIASAYGYYTGSITREECQQIIAGENLATGKVGKAADDIRYSSPTPGQYPPH